MKFIHLLFISILWLPSSLLANAGSLMGKVVAEGQPVPFANLAIENTSHGTSADFDGFFQMEDLPIGEHSLIISAVGYQQLRQQVIISQRTVLDLGDIQLTPDVLGLETVVVTGTMRKTFIKDSPVKVEVITNKYLFDNRSPNNIVESVAMINGVEEVVECGVCGTNSLRINGLEGPYTAVLMDGTPMFGNLASVYGLNGIPASLIDRIEVVKGPSSTLYGSEAVAGVINVITKDPQHQPTLMADIRSTTHREVYGNFGYAPKLGNWNGFIGADYAYVNDFHDQVADGFGDVVGTDRISLFTKWSLNRKSEKPFFLAAKYYYEDRHNGVFEYLNNRAYRQLRGSDSIYGESIYTDRLEFFGTYQLPTAESLKLDFSFSHHDQDSYYGSDYYVAKQRIGFANFLWDKNIGKNAIIIGTTFRHQFYDDNTIATQSEGSNHPSNQFIPGLFAQNEWNANNRFTILTGARLDHYADHGAIFAPRLNVKYKSGDWSTFRLNMGTGFRIVNLFTEDHAFVTGQRTVEITEELSPERSWNAALNFNHVHNLMGGQGTLDIDVFYTYFNNKIIPDYDTPGKIIYSNSNGHAISKGISLSFAQNFHFPLSFNVGLTVQEVTETNINTDGSETTTDLEFAPRYSSTGTINYRLKKPKLLLAWSFNMTGPMQLPEVYDLDEFGEPLPNPRPTRSTTWSRHTVQLSKSFKDSKLQLYGGIENIFNHQQPISPLVGHNDPNAPAGFSEYFDTVYAYAPLSSREFYLGIRWGLD